MKNEDLRMKAHFFSLRDDNELISLINKQDEAALFQFTMKHIKYLEYWIKWHEQGDANETILLQLLLPDFIATVKVFAARYVAKPLPKQWEADFRMLNFKSYSNKLSEIMEERYQLWSEANISKSQVRFLNQLNDLLTKKEAEILEQAREKVPVLKNEFKDKLKFTFSKNCDVKVSFYTTSCRHRASYVSTFEFNQENDKVNKLELLCDRGENWRVPAWFPVLERRCCYLMHELIYHSVMMGEIFNINRVCVDTKIMNSYNNWYIKNNW